MNSTQNLRFGIGNTTLDGLYAKLESSNPSGSIKDRMAKHLLNLAEERNELKEGGTIIEATSGNRYVSCRTRISNDSRYAKKYE